jgi:hypothetical protein
MGGSFEVTYQIDLQSVVAWACAAKSGIRLARREAISCHAFCNNAQEVLWAFRSTKDCHLFNNARDAPGPFLEQALRLLAREWQWRITWTRLPSSDRPCPTMLGKG